MLKMLINVKNVKMPYNNSVMNESRRNFGSYNDNDGRITLMNIRKDMSRVSLEKLLWSKYNCSMIENCNHFTQIVIFC